jgi:CheY-like chemotaxis protein
MEETRNIPIIIATGVMIRPTDLGTALDTGAVDFIKKPFNPIEFNARIRANLRIKEQHELITQLMKSDLERKERELSSAAMFAHEKNTMLIKLLEEFEKLELPPEARVSSDLLQIKRQLKSWLNLDKSWNNFKIHFEEVHPNFFTTLTENYESLSTNEKKMCAYLKIGLDNKEIAVLTNVVSGSVRKALNRLKKKLNLEVEDSLREFISKI